MRSLLTRAAKAAVRRSLPLRSRKRLVVWASRQAWLREQNYMVFDLLGDMAERDPDGFHRFLWSNHLAYAETYDIEQRLSADRLHPTRHMLLDDLVLCLSAGGHDPGGIDSMLDVGCSLGYVLRHMENGAFSGARRLDGIDIDGQAIQQGSEFLARSGSRVRLAVADMSTVDQAFGAEPYDVVLSAGVLMYLREDAAQRVVTAMLNRTRHMLVLTGLAHPDVDNSELSASAVRDRDGTFIHNLDAMIEYAGGRVLHRRWEGARQVEGNTIYFVFASPYSGDPVTAVASSVSAADQP